MLCKNPPSCIIICLFVSILWEIRWIESVKNYPLNLAEPLEFQVFYCRFWLQIFFTTKVSNKKWPQNMMILKPMQKTRSVKWAKGIFGWWKNCKYFKVLLENDRAKYRCQPGPDSIICDTTSLSRWRVSRTTPIPTS